MTDAPDPKSHRAGKNRAAERSGRFEPRPIGELSARLVAKPLGKRGFAAATLVAEWPTIVGPALADSTLPLKVTFAQGERVRGTLHLKIASGAMALQMQHLGPLIIERVNTHFGYGAVAKLAFMQGPLPRPAAPDRVMPATREPQEPAAEVDAALAERIAALPEGELRQALLRLGRRLAPSWQRP